MFDVKKTSKEQIFDAILEKILDSDTYYIDHRVGTNTFQTRKDKKKNEKGTTIAVVEDLDEKVNKTTNRPQHSQLKRTRNKLLKHYKELGETFAKKNNKKTETLDRLLELDRKLESREIKKMQA